MLPDVASSESTHGRRVPHASLPAHHGDCIGLNYGGEGEPLRHVLVDAGPNRGSTDRLARIGELCSDSRRIELLVVSHVDADHIEGAIKLLHRRKAMGLEIGEVWFNGWPQLERLDPTDRQRPWVAAGKAARQRGAAHGGYLGLQLADRSLPWNRAFGGAAVMVPDAGPLPAVTLAGGLTLTLLSPSYPALADLQLNCERASSRQELDEAALRELGGKPRYRGSAKAGRGIAAEPPFAVANWPLDDSVANNSSIAFIAEYAGARVGLFADAHAPVLVAARRRFAAERREARVGLAAAKLPHRGSRANLSRSLLDAINCEHFVISTDGSRFGHPDVEAVEMLKKRKSPTRLVFNHWNTHIERRAASAGVESPVKSATGFGFAYPDDAAAGAVLDLLAL